MTMASSILQYFKQLPETQTGLPSPQGPLRRIIPLAAIEAANREVEAVERSAAKKSLKRGPYQKYTLQLRAAIGRHAAENRVCAATRKYSRQLDKKKLMKVRFVSSKSLHEGKIKKKNGRG